MANEQRLESQASRRRLRLLPVVVLSLLVLLAFKVENVWHGLYGPVLTTAEAQVMDSRKHVDDIANIAPSAGGGSDKADPEGQIDQNTRDQGQQLSSVDEQAAEFEAEVLAKKRSLRRQSFTPTELQVLQSLVKRREALESREKDLELRENLLLATEKRIEGKINDLKELETRIQAHLKQYDEETEQKLQSLVSVYEKMKPKNAARIFEQLDMTILLDVSERMKEAKMAEVMAKMNPERAKELTVELANRRQLPTTGG